MRDLAASGRYLASSCMCACSADKSTTLLISQSITCPAIALRQPSSTTASNRARPPLTGSIQKYPLPSRSSANGRRGVNSTYLSSTDFDTTQLNRTVRRPRRSLNIIACPTPVGPSGAFNWRKSR